MLASLFFPRRFDTERFAHRLRANLLRLGFPSPSIEELCEFSHTEYDDIDFEYLSALLTQTVSEWHSITVGRAGRVRGDTVDKPVVARSRAIALSNVLSELDRLGILPTEVSVNGPQITFLRDGALVCRIAPVAFEPVDPVHRSRIERLLKGMRVLNNATLVCSRLAQLPGLENISPGVENSLSAENSAVLIKTASSLACAMRDGLLAHFGLKLKQHQAQLLLARTVGATNWQHLIAHEEESRCWAYPVAVARSSGTPAGEKTFRFYRTAAEGIWAFAHAVRSYPHGHLAEPLYHGIGITGGVANLTARPVQFAAQRDPESHEIEVELFDLFEDESVPYYIGHANRILRTAELAEQELGNFLGLAAPPRERRALARRRGRSARNWSTQITQWWSAGYAQASTSTSPGTIQVFRHGFWFDRQAKHSYVAEIHYDAGSKICIVKDPSGSRRDLTLTGMSADEVQHLRDYCCEPVQG